MKKIIILISVTILCFLDLALKAQKDTIIVIVDRTAEYVNYKERYISKEEHKQEENTSILGRVSFHVDIESNYFDKSKIKELPNIALSKAFNGSSYFKIDYPEVIIKKKYLKRYKIVTSKTLHETISERKIDDLIGLSPYKLKIVYVVFKSDLLNEHITLHRTIVKCAIVCF